MAGLVPAFHALSGVASERKTWMPGTMPGMTREETKKLHGFIE
jgi:hypothetical protein